MSNKIVWRYSVTCGLRGCYMPNSSSGPLSGTTRRELADLIRGELQMVDAPERAFAQVRIKRLWRFIARNGSSSAHFSIDIGNGECLEFHGLTESEFDQMSAEDDQ